MQLVGPVLRALIMCQEIYLTTCQRSKDRNIALLKPAKQSSTFLEEATGTGKADRAVDGNIDNNYSHRSCSHTNNDDMDLAWWEVDLLTLYTIQNIKIRNRETRAERLHDVTITVYDSDKSSRKKKHCITHPGLAGPDWLSLSCESPVTGRYVRITKPKKDRDDMLTLCEVEIYGKPERKKPRQFPTTLQPLREVYYLGPSYLNCCSICK